MGKGHKKKVSHQASTDKSVDKTDQDEKEKTNGEQTNGEKTNGEKRSEKTEKNSPVPEEFAKVVQDLIRDIQTTFPEYQPLIQKWWKPPSFFEYIDNETERNDAFDRAKQRSIELLFACAQKKLPPRFFDILYQNNDMFLPDAELDTEFLPAIHFKDLWNCEISDQTREIIWKYLQLMLFSVVGSLDSKDAFGDTAKLFEAIHESEFKNKLQETLDQMQDLFSGTNPNENPNPNPNENTNENTGTNEHTHENTNNLPNAEQINEHIAGMLGGKLGQLAREIAEETNLAMDGATDVKEVFQHLMKNPSTLMGLVKTVGDKLESKLKTGELKESEMIQEATDIMNKMKHMPGMENIQAMLGKMGLGGGGKGKMNTGAMEAQLSQRLKLAKMKERMRAKVEASTAEASTTTKREASSSSSSTASTLFTNDDDLIRWIDGKGTRPERSQRGTKPPLHKNIQEPESQQPKVQPQQESQQPESQQPESQPKIQTQNKKKNKK